MANKLTEKFLRLAKVWNDVRTYPANYDIERALNLKMRTIRQHVEQYRDHIRDNPDCGLPELIHRDRRGGHIAVPESVQKQLDEFRFDPDDLVGKAGIIVTAAQYGAPLNNWAWKALKRYAEYRNFPLAVLPIKYGPVKTVYQKEIGERRLASTFPDELKGHIVLDDLECAKGHLRLSTARLRPTLQRFLTDEICEIGGNRSVIFGAPKLELEHRPRIGRSYPKAIMTTGAVSHPNYQVDNIGQQDRTGLLASKNHCYAAIVVEFDKEGFHFRQLHMNKRGEFYDFTKEGVIYTTPAKLEVVEEAVEALVLGDWHTGKTDKTVRKVTVNKMLPFFKPKKLVLHDFFDGDSISHHGVHETSRSAYMGELQWNSLEQELDAAVNELRYIKSCTAAELVLVSSNHPEFVAEYVNSMRWTKEKANMKIGAKLFLMMVEDLERRKPAKVDSRATDPVILWFREKCPWATMVERKQSYQVAGVLVSLHGDIGTRGANTRSLAEYRKMNTRAIFGHNHSATILGGNLWRVGVSTPRMQFYVQNPTTNWTNTHAIVYKNGQIQLVNIIKGKYNA